MPAQKKRMTFTFRLILSELPDEDEVFNALYEAGCGDGSFGWVDDLSFVDLDREATSFAEALDSAIRDVESVPPIRVTQVETDDLLTMSDIGRRLGRTRESVRLWVEGMRGKGGFPPPELGSGRWRFWRWSDVLAWLDDVPAAELERARVIDAVNAALELRRRKAVLPREERRLVHALAG